MTIPKPLLWFEDGWTVLVDITPIRDYTIIPDGKHTHLYFTYDLSTRTVKIIGTNAIPEFTQSIILMLLFDALSAVITKIYKAFSKRWDCCLYKKSMLGKSGYFPLP